MRLDAAIADATNRLTERSDSPRLDAEILLCQTIDMPRSYLFAHPEDELDDLTHQRFDALLQRRLDGEPMAYITGVREFWSRELFVSPATLVPRPETELLVEIALREIPRDAAWQILDLGTGSGAIAIAIAAERPLCDVTASDISAAALAVAVENVRHADLANVSCIAGSWTAPVKGRQFDIIVSNPPYIGKNDPALTDLQFEPLSALASGDDGLDDIRTLARDCATIATQSGWLILEHGWDQSGRVEDILRAEGWNDITCHNDLAGKPRVTAARRSVT